MARSQFIKSFLCAELLGGAFFLVVGCTPAVMRVDANNQSRINPVGFFVIASRQGTDNSDTQHKQFVTDTAIRTVPALLYGKGYETTTLNPDLEIDQVFTKYPLAFYINENRIAEFGKNLRLASVLVVYFAYAFQKATLGTNLNVYSYCSLYGWLIRTDDASVIALSHTSLNSFEDFQKQNFPNENLSLSDKRYQSFFEKLLIDMLSSIPERDSRIGEKANLFSLAHQP